MFTFSAIPRRGSTGIESYTGRAISCHLHFEIWTKPGWYPGGSARPPMKALKRWDRWS